MRVGQLVGAWNPETGGLRWQPVKARSMREAPSVMRLTVRDEAGRIETVVVTPNHPYLRPDGTLDRLRAVAMDPRGELASRWTGAGFLSVGDTVQSASGGTLAVVASEVELGPIQVYNFEVAGDHSFAVGELQAWVHNATFWDKLNPFRGPWRRDPAGNIYYKDKAHPGELEKFCARGKFLGAVSEKRGKPIPGKGPESDPGRSINVK